MKTTFFTFIAFLSITATTVANTNTSVQQQPKVGDTLIVLENTGATYKHINFPRLNIIAKRGGLPTYKSVYNCKVVIAEVTENQYGKVSVKLKRADGKKFFNQKTYVTANYEKAISNGELKIAS